MSAWKLQPSMVLLAPPITAADFRLLDDRVRTVQWCVTISDRDAIRIAVALKSRPDIEVRIYESLPGTLDISVLRHFRSHPRICIDVYNLLSPDTLEELSPDLRTLSLGATKKSLCLAFLQRYKRLEYLSVDGHRKDIECVSSLSRLQGLRLRSITLPSLDLLRPLSRLWWLWVGLGGIHRLSGIEHLPRLKYLELFRVKGLSDLSVIGKCIHLEELWLDSLRQVSQLPRLTRLSQLHRVALHTMNGLTNLDSLGQCTALSDLFVADCPKLTSADVGTIESVPTLRRLTLPKKLARDLSTQRPASPHTTKLWRPWH